MAGEVFAFCVLACWGNVYQVPEQFPKFGKNEMREVAQPWKVLQGLDLEIISSSKARDV